MSAVKHAPATPLPWPELPYKRVANGWMYQREREEIDKDDAYELHAANAYPKLVAAPIEAESQLVNEGVSGAWLRTLLRDLGES
jgi:hypothetical protein